MIEYDKLPKHIQNILDSFDEEKDKYKESQRIVDELAKFGYIGEYGLDGEPYVEGKTEELQATEWFEKHSANYPLEDWGEGKYVK